MLQFLAWFDPSSWLSTIGSEIMGAIEIGIRTLSFSLATIIYKLIIFLYDMFEILCRGRLLDNEILGDISSRIGLVLGLVMFFNIVFSMIKMLLEPDKLNDKEIGAGAILKKIIIVIVLLGFSNFGFSLLYHVQKTVVESHVISNLLLPYKIQDDDLDNFGKVLSFELMGAFYQLEDFGDIALDDESLETVGFCTSSYAYFQNQIIGTGNFNLGYNCLNESIIVKVNSGTGAGVVDTEFFVMNFNWLLCIVAGLVTAYMLFMYCFSVGLRMIQLMFLEILSPVAFVSYLSPKKDTMFNKWGKLYFSTYLDVFIRIVIINFVIFLIATIFSTQGGDGHFIFWESIGGRPDDLASVSFITVVIILALLTFAKKAPDLIKELFPASAAKLGGLSMKDVVGLQKTLNMVTGAASSSAVGLIGGVANRKGLGMITGGIGGALGGALRGAKAGFGAKGIGAALKAGQQAQAKANIATAQRVASGVSISETIADNARGAFGIQTSIANIDKRISENQAVIDAVNSAKSVKAFNEQLENVKENIAVKRNETEIKFLADMEQREINGGALIKQFEMENVIQSDRFKTMSKEEQHRYMSEYNDVVSKNDQSKITDEVITLFNKYNNDNKVYDDAIKRANKRADNMADAVFYLTTGDIASLEKIEGVTKDGDKYYIDGTEVTNWGSIGTTINSYNDRHKTGHKSLGEFKGENGELREQAARQSHRKTSNK